MSAEERIEIEDFGEMLEELSKEDIQLYVIIPLFCN